MRPAPGRVLVKPVETAETLAGGLIILTENVREAWTVGQAEVVAVGPPQACGDEDCERSHEWLFDLMSATRHHPIDPRLKPGSWVLCRPRRFVETGEGYLVNETDIVGVFTAPSD